LPEINADKIGLWGSSFSGGHVLALAAATPGISAVVAQVPFVDGMASAALYPIKFQIQAFAHALLDLAAIAIRAKPHYVPIVGKPEEFALMNTPECYPGVLSILPPDYVWKNYAAGRIALTLPFYRPIKSAPKISCPVLMVCAEKDSLIPIKAVEKTASRIKQARLVKIPAGHFEVYTGERFEKVSRLETDFLAEHLRK